MPNTAEKLKDVLPETQPLALAAEWPLETWQGQDQWMLSKEARLRVQEDLGSKEIQSMWMTVQQPSQVRLANRSISTRDSTGLGSSGRGL